MKYDGTHPDRVKLFVVSLPKKAPLGFFHPVTFPVLDFRYRELVSGSCD
jgi:hypothetical protein